MPLPENIVWSCHQSSVVY